MRCPWGTGTHVFRVRRPCGGGVRPKIPSVDRLFPMRSFSLSLLVTPSTHVPHTPRTHAVAVAYASRTTEPAYARAALAALPIAAGVAMADVAAVAEIYPGTKTTHMAAIAAATGVPATAMLFFDNERRNCVDVAGTGALAVYAPRGLTAHAWEVGLAAYARGERGRIVDGAGERHARGGRRRW